MLGATSSVLAPSSDARGPWSSLRRAYELAVCGDSREVVPLP